MNRIAIFLRKGMYPNHFRETILRTLHSSCVDEALLCSGFFQNNDAYAAGPEFKLIPFRDCSPLRLTVLGLYSNMWKGQFNDFYRDLAVTNPCVCISLQKRRLKGAHWHAKVFIAKANGQPVVGLIGSSNITSRAFGVLPRFNQECDVLFWDEGNSQINTAVEEAIGDIGDGSGVIVANYDDSFRTNGTPLRMRLLSLEDEIIGMSIVE